MFESLRKHSKILMVLLFLLVIPAFVLVGVERSYFSEKSPVVARVDGRDITQADWDGAHRSEVERIRAQAPSLDPALLDAPRLRYASLERLVRERVLAAAAQNLALVTSDARLARSLREIPSIAKLKWNADGTLADVPGYSALLAGLGLTPARFEADLRRTISADQVLGGVSRTAFGASAQASLALDALYERREIEVARFNASDFAGQVAPSDADLQAYYAAHPGQFRKPEQATVEYLVLDQDSVRAAITVSEEELRAHYKDNAQRLAQSEERRTSHILIEAPKDAAPAERAKARARAAELLAQLRRDPARFAELARKYSQDSLSAPAGGDLGFLSRQGMVKHFDAAAFALKQGEISDLVESDFGYHIIELTAIKAPPAQPSFEQARSQLQEELRQQQAPLKFAELAEAFSNAVYEQADSLQPVADKFKLTLHSASAVTRSPAPGAQGALANAKFLQALFAPQALQSKRNTEAMELAPGVIAAGRVSAYTPAAIEPFAAVQARVRSLYVAHKSAELARAQGEKQLAAWQADPAAATGLSAPVEVAREQMRELPPAVVEAALRAPTDKLPAWAGVDLGASGYAVVKINRISPRPPPDAARAQQEREQYRQWLATAETLAYYELLKQRLNARILVPRPEPPQPRAEGPDSAEGAAPARAEN